MATPLEITDATFQQEVIAADKPVLVDFWAPWCGPCRIVGPVLAEIANEQQDRVKIVKVNVDENQQYAGQLSVFNIPTMILYKGGQPVDKIIGALPKQQILDRIEPHLS
ncbi:MAG: Thioredoxin [uncultured Thermomicrobiales bacterium]|uniref:Thioredoxin n=1 Tax=uncultured Thermomicrobiales bacterium TaxID=1645740 RepID=A0A6J4VIT5_9BACT|nr:MAG: Thioredoxin [uncultured Thermomicrobiales bacterium]